MIQYMYSNLDKNNLIECTYLCTFSLPYTDMMQILFTIIENESQSGFERNIYREYLREK